MLRHSLGPVCALRIDELSRKAPADIIQRIVAARQKRRDNLDVSFGSRFFCQSPAYRPRLPNSCRETLDRRHAAVGVA